MEADYSKLKIEQGIIKQAQEYSAKLKLIKIDWIFIDGKLRPKVKIEYE